MNTAGQIELLRNNPNEWNRWRKENPSQCPSLRNVNFIKEFWDESYCQPPYFDGVDFSNTDFHMVALRDCTFYNCCFDNAQIVFADLVGTHFDSCTFVNTCMRVTKIGDAVFHDCTFEDTDLSYCSAENTSFKGSTLKNSRLEHMSLVANDFSNTSIDGCYVYGISAWDINLENSTQKDLIITPDEMADIRVDNIELAQFLYLLINNDKLRDVIDTITSKVVLILGNFSEERKIVLDNIRNQLRTVDFIPVLFDFEKPNSRDLTETVRTLALMSKFVIVDLSSPRSSPHEIANIATSNPSITLYPIILKGEPPFGMFEDHYKNYHWIKPIKEYTDDTLMQLVEEIVKENQS